MHWMAAVRPPRSVRGMRSGPWGLAAAPRIAGIANCDLRPLAVVRHALRGALLCALFFLPAIAAAQDWNYRVRPGDTLWDLGGLYLKPSVRWQQLQQHNRIDNPYQLPPGQLLRFPISWLRIEPAPARVLSVRGKVELSGADGSATRALLAGNSFASVTRCRPRATPASRLNSPTLPACSCASIPGCAGPAQPLRPHRHGRYPRAPPAGPRQQPGDACPWPRLALHHRCTYGDQQRTRHRIPGQRR